jgi:VanZ family protein
MRSRIWLILWLVGILFPMAFLGRFWPAFGKVFDRFFATDLSHLVFHAFLYAILAVLLCRWIRPADSKAWPRVSAVILFIACLHEGIQVVLAAQWPGWPAELTDISVDLVGAILGLAIQKTATLQLGKNHKPS